MRDIQRKIIFGFILFFIAVSLFLPIFLMYKTLWLVPPTARASAFGNIKVNVTATCGDGACDAGQEDCSSCSADCGSCEGGGAVGTGGGGGGKTITGPGPLGRKVTHMLDFRENDWYLLRLFREDKIITVFDNETIYRFEVTELIVYDHITLQLGDNGLSYRINWNEVGLFDFDQDEQNDLEVSFLDDEVKWLNLNVEIEEPSLFPGFGKEPSGENKGVQLGKVVKRFDFVILVIALLVIGLIIFVYHQIKIHMLERDYNKKISHWSKQYGRSKLKKEEKEEIRAKLLKQKRLLKEAYSSKYISSSAYNKGTKRLNSLLRKT